MRACTCHAEHAAPCAGNHDFTVFFKGGTYSSGASCADVLNFGLPDSSFSVAVLNCTHPLAAFPPAAAPEAALAEAAAGAPQPSSVNPFFQTPLILKPSEVPFYR